MAGNIEECLKKFIHHVDNLSHEDEPAGDGFCREFRELREIQQADKAKNVFPAEEGKKECNIKKNRYKDIIPYDSQRVVLKKIDGVDGSDYINASFILDVNGDKSYIASQGPLPHTVNDFWRMLWEHKVEIVFMVCREEESGRSKCQRYWAEEGESKTFGDITVTLESCEEIFHDFVERKICAQLGDQIHRVRQFHYTGWPDHGVPKHSKEIFKMVGKMREERRQLQIPIVIHCSAGCGRTGTICAVDYAWTMLDQGKIAHGFSMFEIIKNIRQQRQSMVQTPDQYEFVHLVVQSLCTDWLEKFQEHDYANFDFDKEGDDEVYYNTMGLSTNSSSDDLYQDVKEPQPLNSPKKPQPTPRPPGLELISNDPNKVMATKAPTESYENVVLQKKKPAPSKPSNGNTNHNLPPKNVAPSGPPKPGHATVITIKPTSKQPPTHTPPSPSTLAHKNAVKNRVHEPIQVNLPTDGTVKQVAKSKNHKHSSNEVPPSQPQPHEDYGVVVKKPVSGRLGSQSEVKVTQIETGQKAREKTDKVLQTSDSDAPVLPERKYDPEEVTKDVHPPGTVSALGGIPNQNNQKLAPRQPGGSSSDIYSEINPGAVQAPPNSQSNNTSGKIFSGLETLLNIKQKPSNPNLGNVNDGHLNKTGFRGQNIGFPNRVEQPKGPRKPKTPWYSTRL